MPAVGRTRAWTLTLGARRAAQAYLRGRRDTIRCIVASLTDDAQVGEAGAGESLFDELSRPADAEVRRPPRGRGREAHARAAACAGALRGQEALIIVCVGAHALDGWPRWAPRGGRLVVRSSQHTGPPD